MCPLCGSKISILFYQDAHRIYLRCKYCFLVFIPPNYYLSREAEKKEYDLHQNSPNDPDYRKFLNRLYQPMNELLRQKSSGLDFGSGPGPTLSLMFQEAGHDVKIFDPFYANQQHVFSHQYDFITATEVVEHLSNPHDELLRLWDCLKPGGILGIMTKLALNRKAFSTWHYKNDLTHICFFSRSTFEWLTNHLNAQLDFIGNDVIILKK